MPVNKRADTQIIGITDLKHASKIKIPERYADRVKEDREATQAESLAAVEHDRADKPIAIWLDAQELGVHVAKRGTPHEFNQLLLRKFRAAGAPIEGSDAGFLRLAHGAVARVKPDPLLHAMGWQYIWLSPEYVTTIAKGVR